MAVDRDRITSRLIYDAKIFCTMLFTETPLRSTDEIARLAFAALWAAVTIKNTNILNNLESIEMV